MKIVSMCGASDFPSSRIPELSNRSGILSTDACSDEDAAGDSLLSPNSSSLRGGMDEEKSSMTLLELPVSVSETGSTDAGVHESRRSERAKGKTARSIRVQPYRVRPHTVKMRGTIGQ